MSDTMRCDQCQQEQPRRDVTGWLRLVGSGHPILRSGDWWSRLPLDFCSAGCLVAFLAGHAERSHIQRIHEA